MVDNVRGMGALAALLACAMPACGDSDPAPADATDDAPRAEGVAVAPPDIPWLEDGRPPIVAPMLLPCADGWHEVTDLGGVTTCAPYAEGGELVCPAGQAQFPGEPSCSPVGSACPSASEFSDALPTDRNVVYVRPGASGDGTGPASPYGSITDFSIASLPTGTVIALSRGTHLGAVRLVRGVAIRGACAADTTLTATAPSATDAVITVSAAEASVHDLTIADSPRPGVVVRDTPALVIVEGVVVDGAEGIALDGLDGARVTAHTIVLRDTRSWSADGTFGRGSNNQNGATVEITRAVLEDNRDIGVFASNAGTSVSLSDVVVRDTEARPSDLTRGRGLNVQSGATIEAQRVGLSRNRAMAMYASRVGSTLTASDLYAADTESKTSDGSEGRAVSVHSGASVELSRAALLRNREVGIVATDAGSSLTVSDAVVRDTVSWARDELFGVGIVVQVGATGRLRRMVVERNLRLGVSVDGEGAAASLSDVVVRDNALDAVEGVGARGMNVQFGAVADVSRAAFEHNRGGVSHHGDGSVLTLSDVVVRDTEPAFDGRFGRGVNIQFGARAEMSRLLSERNHGFGVTVTRESAATISDLVARDTEGRSLDDLYGRGLSVEIGATVEVSRAVIERNREAGVFAVSPDTRATLSDVAVRDTRAQGCAETTCPESPSGHAVSAVMGATLSMTRFITTRSNVCGLLIASDGQMDLDTGEVREHPIGVCLQVDGYDADRLTRDVRFVDNDVNLQATSLPVPMAGDAVPEAP